MERTHMFDSEFLSVHCAEVQPATMAILEHFRSSHLSTSLAQRDYTDSAVLFTIIASLLSRFMRWIAISIARRHALSIVKIDASVLQTTDSQTSLR